jgi:hypothetical protein
MSDFNANTSIRPTQRFLWWCAGANISLLSKCKSDWQKFYTIGLSVILSSISGAISFATVGAIILNNIYFSQALGILWGAIIFNLNRYVSSIFPAQESLSKNLLFIFPRILFAIIISFVISFPMQIFLFKVAIEQNLLIKKLDPMHNFLDKVTALNELRGSNTSVSIIFWLVTISFLTIEMMPILVIWLSPRGAYEKLLAFNENFERQQVEDSKRIEQQKLELSDYFEQQQNELYERERLEILNDAKEKRLRRRSELSAIPFGGLEFYIDYKSLPLNEINSLFETINNIYNLVYRIEGANESAMLLRRSCPEDVLSIHSIETGNSITFKISTGWKPNVELIKGDFIISLPKGSLALLITGHLIAKMFDYGISTYRQILEIQKLEKETEALDDQLLRRQLNSFDSKLESSSDELKEEFQIELFKLYDITLANSNFIQTKITQDALIIKKMKQGQLTIIQSREK